MRGVCSKYLTCLNLLGDVRDGFGRSDGLVSWVGLKIDPLVHRLNDFVVLYFFRLGHLLMFTFIVHSFNKLEKLICSDSNRF